MLSKFPVSQMLTWRSDILLKPVVASLPKSPIQSTREPLIPPWPSVILTDSPPVRGSKRRNFLSLQVVASRVPVGLNAILWMISPWPDRTDRGFSGLARSHNFTVYSPDELATTFEAVGWNDTWPIFRGEASMRNTGSKSWGTQPSWPQPSNEESSTFQINTFPSSPPDATMESLCGDQSVSKTAAVWLRAKGMTSGSLYGMPIVWNGEGRGRIAKAPPPEAFQLTLMYCYSSRVMNTFLISSMEILTPDADIILVSQALFVTFTFSMPYSFFAGWPKTWLNSMSSSIHCRFFWTNTNRYLDALTNLDICSTNISEKKWKKKSEERLILSK